MAQLLVMRDTASVAWLHGCVCYDTCIYACAQTGPVGLICTQHTALVHRASFRLDDDVLDSDLIAFSPLLLPRARRMSESSLTMG